MKTAEELQQEERNRKIDEYRKPFLEAVGSDDTDHTESEDCPCHPRVEEMPNGNKVIVHNSFDHREYFEEDNPKFGGRH